MLENKNIVITGANGGIGKVVCEELISAGANIWACMRKKNTKLEEQLNRRANKNSVWIKPIYFEFGNELSIDKGIQQILNDKLPIDVLVNNAATVKTGLLNLTSVDIIRESFEINLFSQLYLTQKLSKRMIRYKKGNIINISSVSGLLNKEGLLAYGGSKSALNYATKTLANEYNSFGIRVNAIAPGPIKTDKESKYSEQEQEELRKSSYNKRLGTPKDIAKLIAFLASDDSEHITGQIIRIDGGALANV